MSSCRNISDMLVGWLDVPPQRRNVQVGKLFFYVQNYSIQAYLSLKCMDSVRLSEVYKRTQFCQY